MAYDKEKSHRFTFDVPKSVAIKVKKIAKKDKRTSSSMLRILLIKALDSFELEQVS